MERRWDCGTSSKPRQRNETSLVVGTGMYALRFRTRALAVGLEWACILAILHGAEMVSMRAFFTYVHSALDGGFDLLGFGLQNVATHVALQFCKTTIIAMYMHVLPKYRATLLQIFAKPIPTSAHTIPTSFQQNPTSLQPISTSLVDNW